MKTIIFECEVITPMFLAGADGTTPELRPASIKGALRFWWRAMNGHLVGEKGDLTALKEREAEIFGGSYKDAEGKEMALRSKIVIRVISKDVHTHQFGRVSMNIKYLAYGSEERKFIDVGSTFDVKILINGNNSLDIEKTAEEVKTAFSLLTYFGGLGSKSRNGFGSFFSSNIFSYQKMKEKISLINNDYLSFTSFSNQCQIYLVTNDNISIWEDAIKELSDIYKNYGKNSVPKNQRLHIGAPYKGQSPPDRHSKLFLMSVFKENIDDNYKCVITYLPYDYLTDYPEIDKVQKDNAVKSWEKATNVFKDSIYQAKKGRNHLLDTQLD
jgi:CRISPR-associated protein Cmr1